MVERIPPQNIEAEQSLLGCLLLDKDAMTKVSDTLRAEDFYREIHSELYDAMVSLYSKHQPIDLLTLTNELQERGKLEFVGGRSYVVELSTVVPSAAHITHYANIISRKATLRRLIQSASDIVEESYVESKDVDVILDESEQKLFSVSQRYLKHVFIPIQTLLGDAFERIDQLHKHKGQLRGIATGFSDLDHYLAGLQRSDLVILAARPSIGKTTLALDIIRNVARTTPVGLFTIEMSREEVTDRFLAAEAGVSLWKMRTGRLSSEGEFNDFDKIATALDSLAKTKIFIDDSSGPTVLQMRAMARRLQAEHGLGLIVVDYLQLIRSNKNYDNPVQQITEISRNLKGLARELNIPVLALSQLSRAVESRPDQRPKLSDLRDSGSIEQDADVVMFIYREDKVKRDSEKKNVAEIMISKHRNGPTGEVELYFDEDNVSFKNLAKNF